MKQGYEVLARKYRPNKLSELIGQDMLVRTLTNAIEGDRIPHAFILTGIRGVGKTSTARIIARSLVCEGKDGNQEKPTIDPCGECEQCKAISEDRHVDILEMDAASHTGVDSIREIIENVHYHPVNARYKIYIIDEVHMLSKSAFNALLKTLEEPPAHAKFIFATTEIRKIPVTILSRCMRFDLPRVSIEELSNHFFEIAKQEKVKIEEDAVLLIAHAAEGSVRDGLSLLDQAIASNSGEKITSEIVSHMLGIASRDHVFDIFEAIVSGDAKIAISELRSLYQGGADPITILQDLLELSHFITQLKIIPDLANEAHITESERARGNKLVEQLSLPYLARVWQMLLKGISEARIATNSLTAAEMIIIRLMHVSDMPTPGDLIKDMKEGKQSSAPSASPVVAKAEESVPTAPVGGVIPDPDSFEVLVELFSINHELALYAQLQNVYLVEFDRHGRKVEFRPAAYTDANFSGRVSQLLSQWTGNRWVMVVSNAEGQQSLQQQARDALEERKQQAIADPVVQAVLDAFPGAEITNVEDVATVMEDTVQEEPNIQKGEQS